jgi:hypothetical protein
MLGSFLGKRKALIALSFQIRPVVMRFVGGDVGMLRNYPQRKIQILLKFNFGSKKNLRISDLMSQEATKWADIVD